MINLLTAIQTRFNSSDGAALRTLAPGGMTIGESPPGTTHPLIEVVAGTGGDTTPTLSPDEVYGSRIESTIIQFICHSLNRSPLEAWQIAKQVELLYDGAFMTLSSSQSIVDVQRDNPGNEVRDYFDDSWNVIETYTYTYG